MKLGVIVILTPELDEARRFYRDVIGLNLRSETTNQLVFDLAGVATHGPADRRHRVNQFVSQRPVGQNQPHPPHNTSVTELIDAG